jgi:hypothetical protein
MAHFSGFDTHKLNVGAADKFGVDQIPPISNDLSRLPYILAKGVSLTEPLEKKVQEKVQPIESELSIYVAVMTKTCVGGSHSIRIHLLNC